MSEQTAPQKTGFPLLQGKLIDTAGYHISFIVPALCYLFIVFYGFQGSRVRPVPAS